MKKAEVFLVEKMAQWCFAIVGLSLVIAGFIVINLPGLNIDGIIYSLLYLAIGFECLFFAVIIIPLSEMFQNLFLKLTKLILKNWLK